MREQDALALCVLDADEQAHNADHDPADDLGGRIAAAVGRGEPLTLRQLRTVCRVRTTPCASWPRTGYSRAT